VATDARIARICWWIIVALTIGTGETLAQNRHWAGEIRPQGVAGVSPAPRAGEFKLAEPGEPGKPVAQEIRKPQGRHKTNSQPDAKPEPKAQAVAKRPAASTKPERQQRTVAAKAELAKGEECWQSIQATLQPAKLIKLAEQCEKDFPASTHNEKIRLMAAGAHRSLDIQRITGLSADFFDDPVGDAAYRDNLIKAVRGDKDAAYRTALAYKTGTSGVAASSRRTEQWLRFSAELGNGRASWELAEIYNYGGLLADAARFEKKALDLGYRPPVRLPSRGY
jgi:TPR repeat protein